MFSFKFFLLLLAVLATYFSSTLACLQNDAVCKGDGSMGTCCSGFCYQQAGWAEGYCRNRRSRAVCLQGGATCKADGSLGNCCSGYCYVERERSEGYCRDRQ